MSTEATNWRVQALTVGHVVGVVERTEAELNASLDQLRALVYNLMVLRTRRFCDMYVAEVKCSDEGPS